MNIIKYIGIDCTIKYTTNKFNNILSKFDKFDMGDFYIDYIFTRLLGKQHVSTIIKFIDMFQDINDFEADYGSTRVDSLAGNIICMIIGMNQCDKIRVYKIIDHLLKLNMNTSAMYSVGGKVYGINYHDNTNYVNKKNHDIVMYVVEKFNVIQNVRKIINNYDIILFDITDDLQFIELMLLVTKSRHKKLPRFVITHKIVYYYLLDKNVQ